MTAPIPGAAGSPEAAWSNRAEGRLRATFARHGGRTQVGACHEAGGLRLRFPRIYPGTQPDCEAVCINTAGGMVGGDEARFDFACAADAAVCLTTQSAEKIYRSTGRTTRVAVSLRVEAGGVLHWLPQETILFDRVRLARTLDVSLAPDATLLMAETLVFGRLAMGESVREGAVQDRWRIRRGGRLLFAEDFRIAGAIADKLDRTAIGGGARALATLLLVSPVAEALLDPVRAILDDPAVEAGASAWNGLLTLRLLARSPQHLRGTMVAVLAVLRGQAAPRVWQ